MFGDKDLTKTSIGMAKPIYYPSNGTGRDSYITINNGGLNVPFEPNVYDVGSFNQKHSMSVNVPRIESKRVYYTSNGYGRDSYIVDGSGGFLSSGNVRDIYTNGFIDSLRKTRDARTPKIKSNSR